MENDYLLDLSLRCWLQGRFYEFQAVVDWIFFSAHSAIDANELGESNEFLHLGKIPIDEWNNFSLTC